jgi:hypothetical protein
MPSKSHRSVPSTLNDADPSFFPVAEKLTGTDGFSLMESKSGATRGLMYNGKSFGMSSHGRFILKLKPDRAEQLISNGTGKPFSPSPGKTMKGWIEVTEPQADWVELALEAYKSAASAA